MATVAPQVPTSPKSSLSVQPGFLADLNRRLQWKSITQHGWLSCRMSRAFREPWFLSSSRPCDQREQIARQPIPLPAGRSHGRTRGARSLQSAFRPLGPTTPVGEGGAARQFLPSDPASGLRLVWPSSSLRARGRSRHWGVGHASERPRAAAPGALSTHGANGHPATLLTIRVLQVDRPAVQTPVLWGGDIRR